MPRKAAADLSPKEKRKYFLSLYIKAGATEDKIEACTKRAHLRPSSAKKLLRQQKVQAQIRAALEPIRQQQLRQAVVTDAVESAVEIYHRQLTERVEQIKLHKLDQDVIYGRLMQMVVGLDMHRQPEVLHEVIKTAAMIDGAIQIGNTKRVIPAETGQENPSAFVYASIFNRAPSTPTLPPKPSETKPESPDDGISDLYPPDPSKPSPIPDTPVPLVLPPSGESIDEPAAKPKDNSGILTVEIR